MASQIDTENLSPILRSFKEMKESQLAATSLNNYLQTLANFEAFLKKRKKTLDRITRNDIAVFFNQEKKKGNKARTQERKLVTLRQFAKFLWEEDKLDDKEYKKIQGFSVRLEKDNDQRRALLSEEEQDCIKKLTNPIHYYLFWVGLNYGLRASELTKLQVKNVDLQISLLTIRLSKGNKTRQIPILDDHKEKWEKWLRIRSGYQLDHDFVFFSSRGKSSKRAIERYFNQMSEIVFGDSEEARNAKWFTAHTLRYTFATKHWRSGMDLYVLSKILGHASVQTTERYLKVHENEIYEKYRQFATSSL